MSVSWLKHLVGFQLTEEQMRDIPHPYLEMHAHVMLKTAQAFGLLGTVVIGPAVALARPETRTLDDIKSSSYSCGKWGVMLSFLVAPLMTQGVLEAKKADRDSVYDRCYRLRYNRSQAIIDRGSAVGAVSGASLAVPLGESPAMGALVGMSMGFISMACYNYLWLPKK